MKSSRNYLSTIRAPNLPLILLVLKCQWKSLMVIGLLRYSKDLLRGIGIGQKLDVLHGRARILNFNRTYFWPVQTESQENSLSGKCDTKFDLSRFGNLYLPQ